MTRFHHPSIRVCVLLICLGCITSIASSAIIYVDANAPGPVFDGSSWPHAYTNLHAALSKAQAGDEIHVAGGVYRPAGPGGYREIAFQLWKANGTKIKGGYAGCRSQNPDYRDILQYPTILSGDLNGDDGANFTHNTENSYRIIDASGTIALSELDGFTIMGGNANSGKWEYQVGAGLYNIGGNLTIRDCVFLGNSALKCGGAMYNQAPEPSGPQPAGSCNPILINCLFTGNSASVGGCLYSLNSNPVLHRCGFIANQSNTGGALFSSHGTLSLTSCLFNENHANIGGGIGNENSRVTVINCTFSRNTATQNGGAIFCDGPTSALTVINSIVWENPAGQPFNGTVQIASNAGTVIVQYSCVQEWSDWGQWITNTWLEPLFVNPDGSDGIPGTQDDDLGLQRDSPCMDKGDESTYMAPDMLDYKGNPRIAFGTIDMGAIEFSESGTGAVILYVDAGAGGLPDGSSWINAFTDLQKALDVARNSPSIREILVAEGIYRPGGPGVRNATFDLIEGVIMRGGFAGSRGGDHPDQRDLGLFETILSGDLGENDLAFTDPNELLDRPDREDNCYHVVTVTGTNATAVLEGFTITGGNTDENGGGGGILIMSGDPVITDCRIWGNVARIDGGGLSCSFGAPTIRRCTVSRNYAQNGGGMCFDTALATVENNHIEANHASYQGGGILCSSWLSPLIGGNTITGNRAESFGGGICCIETELGPYITGNTIAGNTALDGGGIYCDHSRPDITHNVIDHNRAEDDGGGIASINQPSALIGNNTIVYNRANPQGGGIYCQDSTPVITNCILWGNGDDLHVYARNTAACELNVTYSLVEDAQHGEGNISWAPYFVAPNVMGIGGDYHLKSFSPAIDAGNPASDFVLEPAPNGGRIDMGAFGNTDGASSKAEDGDGDGMPDDWETANGLNPEDGSDAGQDADRDGATNLREYETGSNPDLAYEGANASVYVSHLNAGDPAADGTIFHPFSSIQRAIDVARPGGRIWVTNGVFHERLIVDGKAITIEGGYDPTFLAVTAQKTTVNADRQGRTLTLINVPGGFILENFVITGAQERDGGGIYILGSEPEIRYCEITDNRVIDDGAGIFAFNSAPRFINCTFRGNEGGGSATLYFRYSGGMLSHCLISENIADHSTGIQLSTSTVRISDCRIENNLARSTGGGLVCRRGSTMILENSSVTNNQAGGSLETSYGGVEVFEGATGILSGYCEIAGNSPHGVLVEGSSTIIVEGMVDIDSNDWIARDTEFLDGGGIVWIRSGTRLCVDQCSISCGIAGPGTICIDRYGESTLAGNAYIKTGSFDCQGRLLVKDDAEILGTGTILIALSGELVLEGAAQIHSSTLVCDGLLRVKDNAAIRDSSIIVSRASFEGNAHIESNTISAQAAAPYGQFFIEGTVSVSGNTIRADGDRYMDLDPSTFNGLVTNNRIVVTIPKDTGQASSGLLELRGQPGLANGGTQDPDNPFLWKVNAVPGFDTDNWMIDALILDNHAKLNLTNRFDFHVPFDLDGHEEVLYVRNLKLGAGAVLNTAFNRIYYENLEIDPTAVIKNIPLLGFSLSNIAFKDDTEFSIRITHNNLVHPDNPFYDRIHVERITGLAPDPGGMMWMKNLMDTDPDSPAYGQVIHARAKGLFARVIEPRVLIQFEYLFERSDPGVELDIYLSDHPELPAEGDPGRVKVGTLLPPLPGQSGAKDSGRFGIFSQSVDRGNLNFIRGTRIEFELRGPEGASVLINNWDPLVVECYSGACRDVTGGDGVDMADLYTILQEWGRPASGNRACLEGPFSRNGWVDSADVTDMCWFLSPDNKGGACNKISMTGPLGLLASESAPPPPSGSTEFSIPENNMVLSGLQGITEGYRLFMFNDLGQYLTYFDPAFPQANGRLVLDSENQVLQIQMTRGLVGISDSNSLIPPAMFEDILEPRYKTLGRVQVGLQMANLPSNKILTFGLPLSDAAFDSERYVYVVPVVVEPNLADPSQAYLASAKLKLLPGSNPPYCIVQLYDDIDAANKRDNRNLNGLREIEVDSVGNVYVLNTNTVSMSDSNTQCSSDTLWKYNSITGEMIRRESLSDSTGPVIPSPTSMHVSNTTGLVYLAALSNPDADCSNIYGLSLEDFSLQRTILIREMHHITGISEDPATGRLWVAGFSMRDIPNELPIDSPFYHPYLAWIEPSISEVTAFPLDQTGTEEGNNLSLPLSVLWVGSGCDRADLNQDGIVSFLDLAVMADKWVSTYKLQDLGNLAEHWLESCR